MERKVVVIGSLNYDVCLKQERIPQEGETCFADRVEYCSGGKGANQAVQAAKLGVPTYMVGCIGSDSQGQFLKANIEQYGVRTDYLREVEGNSGMSVAHSLYDGGVRASVVRGANDRVRKEDVDALEGFLKPGDIAVFQLEIPIPVVEYGISFCKAHGCYVILNGAPAAPLEERVLKQVNLFIVNEVEAGFYCGHEILSEETAKEEIRKMAENLGNVCIYTLGKAGSVVCEAGKCEFIPSKKVQAIESTGAGDSFVGGLCYGIVHNMDILKRRGLRPAAARGRYAGLEASRPCRFWEKLVLRFRNSKKGERKEMNYAGRMNSFIFKGENVFDAIAAYRKMNGITHLEFNYPEHIEGYDVEEIRKAMGPLKVNGFAVRWRNLWKNGDFTNPDPKLRQQAIDMTKEASDICRSLGGSVITLWLENDGFDYAFQMDYKTAWDQITEAMREVADYAPDMKISIEYKPFEERNFALMDSAGMTLLMVNAIDRPNVGVTFDFCHMLMKRDNPSYGLALAASQGKLFGLHMNDGYSQQDSGLIFGSVHHAQSLEFVYYLRKYNYQGVVFFDTFPIREAADQETQANIDAFEKYLSIVDELGVEKIDEVVAKRDGISAQKLILGMLRS